MANRIVKLEKVTPLGGAPGIKALAQSLPGGITGQPGAAVARAGGNVSPEVARALPRSEGNATPFELQTEQTDMFDQFTTTIGETFKFYTVNRDVRVTLILQTAGPVVVSTRAQVTPVQTGLGLTLVPLQPVTFALPRGSSLYYGASSVQRVSVIVEPIPWANTIAGKIDNVANAVGQVGRGIVDALRSLTRRQ